MMKYLVLKQLGVERKLKTNDTNDSRTEPNNGDQSVITSKYFPSSNSKKIRRFRSAFTTEQIMYLEKEFKKFPYIGSGNRKEVSNILNIPERAVKIWFQNRRMKEKKEVINKETADEEQNKINIAPQGQSNIKTFNHQSHSSQPYTACQSKLKTIYSDPSITKASIQHFSVNKNVCVSNEPSKSIQDKQKITVKNFNIRNSTETNNSRIVNKVAPVVSRQLNDKSYVPMKITQNKNKCTTKVLTQELPASHKLEHGKVKRGIPKDLTSKTHRCPRVMHPNYYQMNPNQEQRHVPIHVQTLPQPPPFVPGNIIWKPVNMMPVIPGMAAPPQVAHNNRFSIMHQNFPKKHCKCNCSYNTSQEMSPIMQIDGRLHPQSQYILAMPYNHPFNRI